MSNDFWKHRSKEMKCQTCMYSDVKLGKVGRCKRHAPTMSGWPVVILDSDWCGDHKLDENSVVQGLPRNVPDVEKMLEGL